MPSNDELDLPFTPTKEFTDEMRTRTFIAE